MDLRHQSSAMCIIMLGGEDTHPWSATKVGNNIPATIPVTKKQPTNYSNQPLCSRPVEFFYKLLWYKGQKNEAICNKFPRTHLCRSQFLEHRPHCRSEEPLKFVASKSCQLVDRRANDRAFYRDAWWKFHCSRLKNPVIPRPLAEKCIHCLLIRDTSQFYALQPRWRWFPCCIKSLDSGDWVQEHPQPWHPTPAVCPLPKESW